MSSRALFVVAALAALAVALAVVGQRQSTPPAPSAEDRILPGLEADLEALARVVVVAGGGERAVTLEHGTDGWGVAELEGYRADIDRLRAALVALAEARIVERMTADPERYARIGVEPVEQSSARGTLVRLETGNGSSHALVLGDSDRSGERYVRRPDEATSFLVNRDPEVPHDPAQWAAQPIVDIEPSRVQEVVIEHADGETLALSKGEPAQRDFVVAAVPEDRELESPGAANSIGGALRGLRLADVAAFEGADESEPEARVTFETFDGLEIMVEVHTIADARWLAFSAAARETAGDDVREQAETFAARVTGWRYAVPAEREQALTRRIEDLLAAPASE